MFERFTHQARQVVVLAQEQARGLGHNWVGTEHILLGLIAEGRGSGAKVLSSFGFSLERTRGQVEAIISRGTGPVPSDHIPFTPRTRKVLELSLREALRYGHNCISTGHILLAIGREGDGVAARILLDGGASPRVVRQEVGRQFAAAPEAEGGAAEADEMTLRAVRLATSVMREPGTGVRIEVARPLNVAWHQILPLVDAIERRLAAIEEKLGMAAAPPERGEEPGGGPGSSEAPPAAAG
jgi:ATP-dependent Clp protease ATP-binding subunit ClpA